MKNTKLFLGFMLIFLFVMSSSLLAITTEFSIGENSDSTAFTTVSNYYASYSYRNATSTIYWTTQTETGIAFWNVFRSISQNLEQAIQLNVNEVIEGSGMFSELTNYVFEDRFDLEDNTTYYYWIESIAKNGEAELYGQILLFVPCEEPDLTATPDDYGLKQNFPNPFHPSTSIKFTISENSKVELNIYNIKGEKIKTIFNGLINAHQMNTTIWDGKDTFGEQVSAGIYFYKLITDTSIYYKKMIITN